MKSLDFDATIATLNDYLNQTSPATMFRWPNHWTVDSRKEFAFAYAAYMGMNADKIVASAQSVFAAIPWRYVADYMSYTLALMKDQEAEPQAKPRPEDEFNDEQIDSIIKLAALQAKVDHYLTPGLQGHDEYFDECDHLICKLFREK